jgi:putative ABC transport system permease protein
MVCQVDLRSAVSTARAPEDQMGGFAYRIELSWGIYTLSVLLAVLCALMAVSYHTLRAAMANPINSLRTDG